MTDIDERLDRFHRFHWREQWQWDRNETDAPPTNTKWWSDMTEAERDELDFVDPPPRPIIEGQIESAVLAQDIREKYPLVRLERTDADRMRDWRTRTKSEIESLRKIIGRLAGNDCIDDFIRKNKGF